MCPLLGPNSAAWAWSTDLTQHSVLWPPCYDRQTLLATASTEQMVVSFCHWHLSAGLESSNITLAFHTTSLFATSTVTHLKADQYSPKSRNCFMESGEGENLEKCSICFGTLAKAAFFIINLTNFIIAELSGSCVWPQRPMLWCCSASICPNLLSCCR